MERYVPPDLDVLATQTGSLTSPLPTPDWYQHNWEYTGHRCARSAALALSERLQASNAASVLNAATAAASAPSAAASQHPGADVGRMLFAGHSMGGHGAWELASHMPDRALGVVSVAGWLRKEYVTLRRVMA